MKKRLFLDIPAILLLIGSHYVQVFARKKIGFVRWLNFNNKKIHEALPFEMIKYLALAALVILAFAAAVMLIKRRASLNIADWVMLVIMCAVTIYYAYAAMTNAYDSTRTDFLILPMIIVAALLLIIRNMARIRTLGSEVQRPAK